MMLVTLGDPGDLCSALLGAMAEEMGFVHIHCDEEEFGMKWSIRDDSNISVEQQLVIHNNIKFRTIKTIQALPTKTYHIKKVRETGLNY